MLFGRDGENKQMPMDREKRGYLIDATGRAAFLVSVMACHFSCVLCQKTDINLESSDQEPCLHLFARLSVYHGITVLHRYLHDQFNLQFFGGVFSS
ncbi:hypothetical protein V6N13_045409 [Hibiscus sabdariffa]